MNSSHTLMISWLSFLFSFWIVCCCFILCVFLLLLLLLLLLCLFVVVVFLLLFFLFVFFCCCFFFFFFFQKVSLNPVISSWVISVNIYEHVNGKYLLYIITESPDWRGVVHVLGNNSWNLVLTCITLKSFQPTSLNISFNPVARITFNMKRRFFVLNVVSP